MTSFRDANPPPASLPGLPGWVSRLGVPAWITDAGQRLRWMNAHAEELLGIPPASYMWRPCYEVVGGRWFVKSGGNFSTGGRLAPFCRYRCPLLSSIEDRRELGPLELCLRGPRRTQHWIHLLPILVHDCAAGGRDARLLVHCALPADREHRIEGYLAQVASRSSHPEHGDALARLSRREREVLSLLAGDLTPGEVADRLHVSYVTVRNHIQHVLPKLAVHSTMEAVAMYLLGAGEGVANRGSKGDPGERQAQREGRIAAASKG